jgi:multidrug efflux pump subunit AcrA (membrane-fusion protein)
MKAKFMIGFFKNFLLIIFVAILVGLIGIYVVKKISREGEPKNQLIGVAKKQTLSQRITFAGMMASQKRSVIAAPYNGYVKTIFVKVGDQVKQGDPVVSISASLDAFEEVHPLRAPFNGLVTLIRKTKGEFVKENDASDYVMRIDDVSRFFVEARVPEIDRMKINVGQQAIIKVAAIFDTPLNGRVEKLALAPEEKGPGPIFGGRSQIEYQVLIAMEGQHERLMPGLSAIIDVIIASVKDAITLGHEFIHQEDDHYFVIMKNGEKRSITVGLKNDEGMEITSGLDEGEMVLPIEFVP